MDQGSGPRHRHSRALILRFEMVSYFRLRGPAVTRLYVVPI